MEFIYLMALDLANNDTRAPSERKQPLKPDDEGYAPDTGSERPGYSAVRSDANSEPDNTSDHAIDRPKKRKTSNEFAALLELFSRSFSDTLKTLFLFYELEGRKKTIVDYFVTYPFGFTDLHRKFTNARDEGFALESILSMRPPNIRKADHKSSSIPVKNGMARDIFGWTPFHYATARAYL
ncbi:hypothetical protein ACJA88_014313 [Fusarium oxysporum]